MGVADEARIEFDRLADQRSRVRDECVWNAAAAEKGFWNFALRFIDRVNSYRGRSEMITRVQTFYMSQINVCEKCRKQLCCRKIRPVEGGHSEIRHANIRSAEVRPA